MSDFTIIVIICALALLGLLAIAGFIAMAATFSGQAAKALQKHAGD